MSDKPVAGFISDTELLVFYRGVAVIIDYETPGSVTIVEGKSVEEILRKIAESRADEKFPADRVYQVLMEFFEKSTKDFQFERGKLGWYA